MSTTIYPQPTQTTTNTPLIEGWQRGELMLQRCDECQTMIFFPRDFCPQCWSPKLTWTRSSGRGKIVSYTLVYKHVSAAFSAEAPTVLAEIALADGVSMISRVVTSDPASVASGMEVELVPTTDAARYSLPTFQLRT